MALMASDQEAEYMSSCRRTCSRIPMEETLEIARKGCLVLFDA